MNAPVSLKPAVRTAQPQDEQEIYRLLMLACAENAIYKPNPARVMWHVKRFLYGHQLPEWDTGPRGEFGVIGEPGGPLQALCMVGLASIWYSDEGHLEEYLTFVDPAYRKGSWRHGISLIEWAKEKAKRLNLALMIGVMSNHRTEAKCRLYRRHVAKIGEYFFASPKGLPQFWADDVTGPGSQIQQIQVSSSKAA